MSKKLLWGGGLALCLLAVSLAFLFFSLNSGFSANYYAARADDYLDRGDTGRAIQALELALRSDPERTASRVQLAKLYRQTDREPEAEALLQEGIRLSGRSSACWLELARLYVSQGRLEAAATLLDRPKEGYLSLTIGQRRPRFALSRPAGTYGAPLTLSMAPETGTVCYYTLDGTVPDLSSPVWPGRLELGEGSHILTMVAVREDLPSPILRAQYTVTEAAPAFSLAGEDPRLLLEYLRALDALLAEHGYFLP